MTGAALQIFFEMLSQLECFEGRVEFDFPRDVLGCVATFARIVISEPLLQVGRDRAGLSQTGSEECKCRT